MKNLNNTLNYVDLNIIHFCIGGKPGLAFYIVGYDEDKAIYLDPHFVQVIQDLMGKDFY